MKIHQTLTVISLFTLFTAHARATIDMQELRRNNITLVSDDIDERNIKNFLKEYYKFPLPLRQEMLNRGATIRLLEGHGVTEDPTWAAAHKHDIKTKDGRDWSDVVGCGGSPFAKGPTRIVINHLYDSHGSANLVLHEHAHALDSTYNAFGLSKSKTWRNLMENNKNVNSYLHQCGDYCNQNEEERFAELFALYHNNTTSRREMERMVPEVADFFKNLRNIKSIVFAEQIAKQAAQEKIDAERRVQDEQEKAERAQARKEKVDKAVGWTKNVFHKGLNWAKEKTHQDGQE